MWTSSMVSLILVAFSLGLIWSVGVSVSTWGSQGIFSLGLVANNLDSSFMMLVLIVAISVFGWGGSYMSSSFKLSLFFSSLGVFVSSMLILTLSDSFIMIFLGWEGLGVSSFLLIMFYHNWMSAKGALLTLLTNRLGDGVFLLLFAYWASSCLSVMGSMESAVILISLLVVAITKSAQWPFINWLPAAMAAPTPVSALVHSSTLVTAGVWLMIRFSQNLVLVSSAWLILGVITLLVASVTALSEKDAKKVVALSTLSQLGMMFLALSVGNYLICLFHIFMHALAKANLFMVVGELLHKSFSQQDMRYLSSTSLNKALVLSMIISIASLAGLVFSSGFFSKEQILTNHYTYINAVFSWGLVAIISGLTFSYCTILVLNLVSVNHFSKMTSMPTSMLSTYPIITLSYLSVMIGWLVSLNLSLYGVMHNSMQGWYWTLPLFGWLFMFLGLKLFDVSALGFYAQNKVLDLVILENLISMKSSSTMLESSGLETLYLITSLQVSTLFKYSLRVVTLLSCLMVYLVLF